MAVTRKLPKPKDPRTLRQRFFSRGDAFAVTGFGWTAILAFCVVVFALRPFGAGHRADLGKWAPLLTEEAAAQAIEVVYDADTRRVQLQERPGSLDYIVDPDHRSYVRTHIRRFNKTFENRAYDPDRAARLCRDCVLWVDLPDNGRGGPELKVRDLSSYNIAPNKDRRARTMGSIYLRPSAKPVSFLSDGFLGLFLSPDSDLEQSLSLTRSGLHGGGRFTLTDEHDLARATVWAGEDGQTIGIRAEGGKKIFIENNAPESGEDRELTQGQVVEIAGRFFETRVEKSVVAATSAKGDGGGKRYYPMGHNLHFVGPVSPQDTHQPLGLEYLFREYLTGVPERNIPPGEIWLTLDPELQGMLTQNVQELARNSEADPDSVLASGLIMDAGTGAILAMAAEPVVYDPGNERQVVDLIRAKRTGSANHGCFKRHVIGSVTKPFFAFIALHLMPETTELRVHGGDSETFFGHRLYGNNKAFVFKRPVADFANYLIDSDNAYQHGFGLILLAGVDDLNKIPKPWLVKDGAGLHLYPTRKSESLAFGGLGPKPDRMVITHDNPFARALREVFGIETSPAEGVVDDRDLSLYGRLNQTTIAILKRANPGVEEPINILKRRSVVCAPASPRMELEGVANTKDASNILFGAYRNMWTDVKLCESFSRMVTGNKVEARLVYKYLDTLGELPPPENTEQTATGPAEIVLEAEAKSFRELDIDIKPRVFAEMRKQLALVPERGTAKLLAPVLKNMRNAPPMRRFKLFAKTGTIDDGKDKPDSKLLIGTFGIWNETEEKFEGRAATFTFYLRHARDEEAILKVVAKALPQWWAQLMRTQSPDI